MRGQAGTRTDLDALGRCARLIGELRAYFASLRAALSDLRIVREQIIADGRFLAARNTFAGDFTGVFTARRREGAGVILAG